MTRDEPAPSNPPPAAVSTPVVSTVVSTTVDDAGVVDQLSAFCDEFVVPLRDADARWQPSDMETEAFASVLIATEQAADAMTELTGPLGERMSMSADQALDAATDAHLALSVGRSDTVDAIAATRDLVFAAPAASGASQLTASCQP